MLSRVSLPTDITDMVDTLVCGFFPQMDDIDVILKCGLRAALIATVFFRTEEGSLRYGFPTPSLVELEILRSDIFATLLTYDAKIGILLLFPFPSSLFQFFLR